MARVPTLSYGDPDERLARHRAELLASPAMARVGADQFEEYLRAVRATMPEAGVIRPDSSSGTSETRETVRRGFLGIGRVEHVTSHGEVTEMHSLPLFRDGDGRIDAEANVVRQSAMPTLMMPETMFRPSWRQRIAMAFLRRLLRDQLAAQPSEAQVRAQMEEHLRDAFTRMRALEDTDAGPDGTGRGPDAG